MAVAAATSIVVFKVTPDVGLTFQLLVSKLVASGVLPLRLTVLATQELSLSTVGVGLVNSPLLMILMLSVSIGQVPFFTETVTSTVPVVLVKPEINVELVVALLNVSELVVRPCDPACHCRLDVQLLVGTTHRDVVPTIGAYHWDAGILVHLNGRCIGGCVAQYLVGDCILETVIG